MRGIKNVFSSFLRSVSRRSAVPSTSVAPAFAPRLGATSLTQALTTPMAVATVYQCVRLLSDSVATMPLRFMRYRDGYYSEDEQSIYGYLADCQPNELQSGYDMKRRIVIELLLSGNAYILPTYPIDSLTPDRLVLLSRGTVTHNADAGTYEIHDPVHHIHGVYGSSEIIHIKGMPGADSRRGVSVLAYAAQTIAIARTGDDETQNRFANGGNIRGLVGNDTSRVGFGEYADEELQAAAANIDQRFSNGERIVSLPGAVDFRQLSLSSTDMQFLESRKFTVVEIARFFGLHPSYVFADTATNYKSAEEASATFLTTTLNPLLKNIEGEFNRKLISPRLWRRYKFEFDRRGLLACDLSSRAQYQTQTISAGIYTVNDWRRLENQPPVPGGDTPLVSANLRAIDEITQPKSDI